jgi:hypothetical protein
MAEPEKRAPDNGRYYSDEQQRLLGQVEIIQRDVEMTPFGQPFKKSSSAVDADTGEVIRYSDIKTHKGTLVKDEDGYIITPEEQLMLTQGWGRIANESITKDGTWKVNANVGIRTRGDDALDITLVEKGTPKAPSQTVSIYNRNWQEVEPRTWEYHISRKGADKTDPDNVLVVPVHSAFRGGLLADIGNPGSSYSSENVTLKSFQPQKVLRHADDIDINVPYPAGMGSTLVILERDPFTAFSEKTAYKGGKVIVPDASVERVRKGYHSVAATIRGAGNKWGEVIYSGVLDEKDVTAINERVTGNIYSKPAIPQDGVRFVDHSGKEINGMVFPAVDASGIVPEGAEVKMWGNTGLGPDMTVDGKEVHVPPHAGSSSAPAVAAWNAPPVWLHGPGNKGTVDISGLDGRIVISGGGTIKLSQQPIKNWWYSDVILTGGQKDAKAVYTIEVPQFEEPKLKLHLNGKHGGKDYRLERYPMPPYQNIPLHYPDDTQVPMRDTENDRISIRGDNIEVWVKEGEKTYKIYDSEQPQLNQQSGILKQDGIKIGATTLVAAASKEELLAQEPTRRQFLKAGVGAATAALLAEHASGGQASRGVGIKTSGITALDPATASLEALMPDVQLTHGHSIVHTRPQQSIGKVASRG